MSEIDRRTLIGVASVAGAGLALTGCGGPKSFTDGCQIGEGELWGETVNKSHPTATTFSPRYICAAYIKFAPNGPIIRQGYAPLPTAPITVNEQIIDLLRKLRTPQNPPNVLHPRYNFTTFSLKGPHILVIYIDNNRDEARFLEVGDILNDPLEVGETRPPERRLLDHIIRFSKFSGNNRKVIEKNYAFYDIDDVPMPTSGFDGRVAYRLNYYNTDEDGNTWDNVTTNASTHKIFSMNIHYLARSNPAGGGGSVMIPMILDPDTGNMGAEP